MRHYELSADEQVWSNQRFQPIEAEPEPPTVPDPTPWTGEGEARYVVEIMPRHFSEPMTFAKALALHHCNGGPMLAIVQTETGYWEGGERDTEGDNATGAYDGGEQLIRVDTFAWEDWGEGEWKWGESPIESETLLESEL